VSNASGARDRAVRGTVGSGGSIPDCASTGSGTAPAGAPGPITTGPRRIVDRRADPPGRGTVNRERFIRRFKDDIKRAADEEFGKRSIKDVGRGGHISIAGRGLTEPRLTHDDDTGNRDFVLPGNREYVPGDSISRPRRGGEDGGDGDDS